MSRHALIPLLFYLLPGCAGPPPVGEAASPIIGGTKTSGDPAVVLLISYPPNKSTFFTCTAVAISPTVLLTAAHCVDAPNHPNHLFGAFTGPDASAYMTADAISKVLVPAQSVAAHPNYDPNPPFHADIGVVVLAQPLAVTPFPWNRDPVDPKLVGGPARLVGYGQVVYNQFNVVKYEAPTVLVAIDPMADTVTVGDAMHRSCLGDSGGPALVKIAGVETVIGVDSYTDTVGCIEPAHYRRTDMYTAFIDAYVSPIQMDAGPTGSSGAGGGMGASSNSTSSAGSGMGGAGGAGGGAGMDDPSAGCACALPKGGASGAPALVGLLLPLATAWRRRAVNRRRGARRSPAR